MGYEARAHEDKAMFANAECTISLGGGVMILTIRARGYIGMVVSSYVRSIVIMSRHVAGSHQER